MMVLQEHIENNNIRAGNYTIDGNTSPYCNSQYVSQRETSCFETTHKNTFCLLFVISLNNPTRLSLVLNTLYSRYLRPVIVVL